MKRIFTSLVALCAATLMMAQPHGGMKFAGPSRFGVEAMNAWQENENDTIVFLMKSMSEADITIPTMNYKAMGLTIPSFTIPSARFSMDMATRNAVFDEQTFETTATVDGEVKQIKGTSFSATYNHAGQTFEIQMVISYGKMPFPVTFSINAAYVKPETDTAITGVNASAVDVKKVYDLQGQTVRQVRSGTIYIINGQKQIVR